MKRWIGILILGIGLALCPTAKAQTPVQHGITVSWTASTTPGVTYNIYGATASGGPYTKLTTAPVSTLSFLDATATDGKAHFYVATSVSATGVESQFSTQTTATALAVPNPPTGLAATAQ